jgi:hypothetical protein
VRFIIAMAFAAVVLIPAAAPVQAAGAPQLTQQGPASELSAAKKKKAKRKAAKKEEYLRAVPSTPPAGAKQ